MSTQEAPRSRPAADVTGLVLCGGQSTRMGADKALLEVGGRRLLDIALAALDEVAGQVLLATGERARYADTGRASVLDAFPGSGPLGGLLAGLEAAAAAGIPWVAVLACDMPRADGAVLAALLAHARGQGLDACLLELERGTQPLCAVYRSSCAPAVRASLLAGGRRMIDFHRQPGFGLRIGSLRVDAPGLPAGSRMAAWNLNTPEELAAERSSAAECGR